MLITRRAERRRAEPVQGSVSANTGRVLPGSGQFRNLVRGESRPLPPLAPRCAVVPYRARCFLSRRRPACGRLVRMSHTVPGTAPMTSTTAPRARLATRFVALLIDLVIVSGLVAAIGLTAAAVTDGRVRISSSVVSAQDCQTVPVPEPLALPNSVTADVRRCTRSLFGFVYDRQLIVLSTRRDSPSIRSTSISWSCRRWRSICCCSNGGAARRPASGWSGRRWCPKAADGRAYCNQRSARWRG